MKKYKNDTPTLRKQSVWLQITSLVSTLLLVLMENAWFMENFSETGGYIIMAYNATAIVLSTTKPINPKHEELLRDEHEDEFIG